MRPADAYIVAQLALYEKKKVYAFTRVGDVQAQNFAKKRGAHWAGDSETPPPVPLDTALACLKKEAIQGAAVLIMENESLDH